MIDFKPITITDKALYKQYLITETERGCEYSFVNLFLWGRQQATILHDHLVLFSQFNRRSVYPYPMGTGDKRPVLDAIIADAGERGIPCRITGLNASEKQALEEMYPGRFRFHGARDSFDYVYDINDLADLKGGKYQRKRNHYKQFCKNYPNYTVEPFNDENLPQVKRMLEQWFETIMQETPDEDFHMERAALSKALKHYKELDIEGLLLKDDNKILAVTLGSQLSANTFDVQFEKAPRDINGAYTAINYEFARYLRAKYPQILFLNREEDMGLEGLRKAKERYYPHHMVEKYWACLLDDDYEY